MKFYNGFLVNALRNLIDASRESIELLGFGRGTMSSMQFLREFKTIRCSAARRCGHSVAMFYVVEKEFPRSLIVVPTDEQVDFLNELAVDLQIDTKHVDIVSESKIKSFMRKIDADTLASYSAVFFDDATYVERDIVDFVYEEFVSNSSNTPFFIFIH